MTSLGDACMVMSEMEHAWDRGRLKDWLTKHVDGYESRLSFYEKDDSMVWFDLVCRIPGIDRPVRLHRNLLPLPRDPQITLIIEDPDDPIRHAFGSTPMAEEISKWVEWMIEEVCAGRKP